MRRNHAKRGCITTTWPLPPALRRLGLHGIIERIPRSRRYQPTPQGLRIALFFSRTYPRLLRPKLAGILTAQIDACCKEERLVA